MARGVLTGTVVDGNGQIITEATVTIYDADTTDAAKIYDAKSGGNIITDGIITANSNGYWIAYADPADYAREDLFDIVSSKANYATRTQADYPAAGMTVLEWDDLRVPLTQTQRGATSKPDFDVTNVGYLFPQNDNTEILYFIVQMPHSWKIGTDIKPHIHWQQSADLEATWKLDYKILEVGEAVPAGFTTISGTTVSVTYVSGDLHQQTPLTDIDMSGVTGTSAVILGKLYRDDNTYTGDALAFDFDFHFQMDAIGSRDENTK